MKDNIIIGLLTLCLAGTLYIIYYQHIVVPEAIIDCNDIAIVYEKLRHPSPDDLTVTNQDITGYMKNFTKCMAATL